MTYLLWVSSNPSTPIDPLEDSPGPDWLQVGRIDSARENDLRKAVQGALGIRSSSRRSATFYADIDESSLWLTPDKIGPRHPFGLVLRVPKDFRYLEVTGVARCTTVGRRPPESHPGSLVLSTPIGITVSAANGEPLFRSVRIAR